MDDEVSSLLEDEMFGTRLVNEPLREVTTERADMTDHHAADRERLQTEIDRLVGRLAAGVPANTVARSITERQAAIARFDANVIRPRRETPDGEHVRRMARTAGALVRRASRLTKAGLAPRSSISGSIAL
jgi:hypothetical protein